MVRRRGTRHRLVLVLAWGAMATPLPGQQRTDTTARPVRSLSTLVVTATRAPQALGTLPANVTVLGGEATTSTNAQTVPGLLARIPGYASRDYQHPLLTSPTRSTPSFRGLGGSSSGRTLVLYDGIPLNEPFNGTVYWDRVPMALVDRVEVVRGGGSMLWGSRALGGVINVMTLRPDRDRLDLSLEAGGKATVRGTAAGTLRRGRVQAMGAGSWGETNGFRVIRPDQAGQVDVPTSSNQSTVMGRVTVDLGRSWQAYLAGNYLNQWHVGPTAADSGPATVGEVRAGARWASASGGVLDFSAYANHRSVLVIATNVSDDRSVETPRSYNRNPSDGLGASLQWSQTLHDQTITGGGDLSIGTGTSLDDYGWTAGQMTRRRTTDGRQQLFGLFAQDAWRPGEGWQVQLGVRQDWVGNSNGRRVEEDLVRGQTLSDTAYNTHTFTNFSFTAGVRRELTGWLALRASGYQAFRAPTLGEMYRPNKGTGRGNITEANPSLSPERLIGAELGVDLTPSAGLLMRLGGFWNQVHDPIVDYTIGLATANGQVIEPCGVMLKNQVCRQRQNVEGLRTTGLEAELELHPSQAWSIWSSYTYNPTWISAPGQQIDGHLARSAPVHAISGFVTWENPRLLGVTLEARYVGSRYDDDLNTIQYDGFTVIGMRVNRQLFGKASAYLKIENLLNAAYAVTRTTTGIEELGGPRWVLVGMHAAW